MNKFLASLFRISKVKNEVEHGTNRYPGLIAYLEAKEIFFNDNMQNRNIEKALELYDIAITHGIKEAFSERAFCLQELNYHFDAIQDFDNAIDNNSEDANLYFGRAHSKSCISNFEESITDFRKAIELSKVDLELNRLYTSKMKESGWKSVTNFYENQLRITLTWHRQSLEPALKEFYEIKARNVKRRNSTKDGL